MNRTTAFILAGLAGAVALLVGLAWDSYLHAHDPNLVHNEGLFTLRNPGHVLLGIGIVLVVGGLIAAGYTSLPIGKWARRGYLLGALVLIVISGDVSGWAASVEWGSSHPASASTHQHGAAPNVAPTPQQVAAAFKLVEDTKAAVAKYKDQRVAIAAGYTPMEPPDFQIVHWVNQAYFTDADILRPDHVQSLIYFNTAKGPVLIGAMYIMPRLGMPGPDIGGPLTVWHHHDNLCFDSTTHMIVAFTRSAFFDGTDKAGACPRGSSIYRTPEMLHVWLIDTPGGPFATDMDPDVAAAELAALSS